jgi:hypothetical protein
LSFLQVSGKTYTMGMGPADEDLEKYPGMGT